LLRVCVGDRVQVRLERDEGYALTHLRTPPGSVVAIEGTGADASITVGLASGQVITYSPVDLELLVPEPAC
jgi:hypothetical protein